MGGARRRAARADRAGDVAVRTLDGSVSWTWQELGARVDALAGGLRGLGVERVEQVLARRTGQVLEQVGDVEHRGSRHPVALEEIGELSAFIMRRPASLT